MRSLYILFAAFGVCGLLVGCGGTATFERAAPSSSEPRFYDAPSESDAAPAADSEAEPEFNTETYDHIDENDFLAAWSNPLSTFSIDVDTASYSNMRRFLQRGQRPPPGAVRIEELVNYFPYDYPAPEGDAPFAVNAEIASCPWAPEHRLVRFGLKGREIALEARPVSNLVFLIDVSGSMNDANKLPLVKESMRLLVQQLGENDRVAIVVYASATGLVLPSTSADDKTAILAALDQLHAGGSTNGGEGIELAYQVAIENYIEGGTNRVILCSDGDFNVGITDRSRLTNLIEDKAASGVFLSVLGFGMCSNYAYIDTLLEGRKVLVEQMTGTLITIAKDVKIQVEFNPAKVAAYRLIGYENRLLAAEDFRDDTKDAGEIGAGHTVTALYEIVPVGVEVPTRGDVDPLRYQQPGDLTPQAFGDELLTLKLRYKAPDSESSEGNELSFPIRDPDAHFAEATPDFQFAAAVASFGMLLRDSAYKGNATYAAVKEWAQTGLGPDEFGYRSEFLGLVAAAERL